MARTSPHIGHNAMEMMNLILEFVNNFNVDRLLYAINGKSLDEDEISNLTFDIKDYNVKLERQKKHLFDFGKTFNKRFTTDNNRCFDSSIKIARKIRSGTSGAKKVFQIFCKPFRRKLPDGCENPQAHKRSMINTPNYSADLFGLPSYPQCVKDLFTVMLEFYGNLDDCIDECKRQLQQERETRGDFKLLLKLLDQAIEKSQREQAHIIIAMDSNPQMRDAIMNDESLSSDKHNPVLKAYKQGNSKDKFAQTYFHNCSPSDISKITLFKAYSDSGEDPEMMKAMAVFGNDKEHIADINNIIDHFDELLPAKCKRNKVPAILLLSFMQWCKPEVGTKSFLGYFNKRYTANGGKWSTIKPSAIAGATSKSLFDKETEAIKKEFTEKIDDYVKKIHDKK